MTKFKWSDAELTQAKRARDLGLILMKDWSQQSYTIYDHPELEGAWTCVNELIWSHELQDIKHYLDTYAA